MGDDRLGAIADRFSPTTDGVCLSTRLGKAQS